MANETIQGKNGIDEAIEEQRNTTTHFKYAQKMMFGSPGDMVTLEKEAETEYGNGRRTLSKFGTMRHFFMPLENLTTG